MKEHIKPCICKTCLKARNKTQELRKKIEGMKKEEKGWTQCKGIGCHQDEVNKDNVNYNRALADILEAIK